MRGTTPANRTDNFYETVKKKFFEIQEISSKMDVDYILHGGDWFDRPDISPSIVREFALIIRNMRKPVYTVAGNHDLYGQNPNTVQRTMLGLLDGAGLVKLMEAEDEIIIEKDNIRVQLTGKPYRYDMDGEGYRDYYIIKKRKDADYALNIVHGMLLKKPFIKGVEFTLLEDIYDTEADITLSGHYHTGFGVVRHNNKYFINPGSLVRIANSLSEIKRVPEIVLIELGEEIKISILRLKSALNGKEVLDRTKLLKQREKNEKLDRFHEEIVRKYVRELDLNAVISEIHGLPDLNKEIKEEMFRRIAAAREVLNTGEE